MTHFAIQMMQVSSMIDDHLVLLENHPVSKWGGGGGEFVSVIIYIMQLKKKSPDSLFGLYYMYIARRI